MAYVAVKVLVPAVVELSEQLPAPAANVPEQFVLPSLTVTLPVGVPVPGACTVTVKFTVYACPTTDGSGVTVPIVVVVAAPFTVCDLVPELGL